MTMVVSTYILMEPNLALGRFIPAHIAIIMGGGITLIIAAFYILKLFFKKKEPVEEKSE